MRRRLGYALAVVTGYLLALWVSHVDQSWGWYGPSHGNDALAMFVWVVGTVALVRLVRVVTR